jgi:hypothetical protein
LHPVLSRCARRARPSQPSARPGAWRHRC